MRPILFFFIGLFLLALAPQATACVESVPVNQSSASYNSYLEGMKHNKAGFLKKATLFKKVKKQRFGKETDNDGIVAAILAFVLGGIGIHRVYLGSDGIIILWYILTIFGIFGIIPLIDFFRLLINGSGHYRNNNDLFAAFKPE
ncbi:MAG: TM2 domain-containing protein [Bacteroidetes bacterium]|nr:MAG: TM2 domain-containing protein [Bacteroidota bacterium]